MRSDYQTPILRQFCDQQVRFAPRDKKIEQLGRAEKLLGELDPGRTYSYEYLCFRITDYRPDALPPKTMSGRDARHDLRLFVEDVSDAADIAVEDAGEPVHTVDDLSKIFKVSTKTISRWRQQGLVSRRFLFGRRKRVGFLRSSVELFVSRNHERVKRGERFSQLSDDEREEIIERARRLAQQGGCPSEIAQRIAQQMGRSVETIRYTLKQFDDRHPDLAIFPNQSGPLSEEAKEKVYQQYRKGVSVDKLAKRYCRTRTSIYRVVNEMRARRILDLPLDFIDNECFRKQGAGQQILVPMPVAEESKRKSRPPTGLPPYLSSLYETPLLSREQEYHLFRKLNFLKFQASRLRAGMDPSKARSSVMDRIESLYDDAVRTKNEIVQANLRLVVSIAKRQLLRRRTFSAWSATGTSH